MSCRLGNDGVDAGGDEPRGADAAHTFCDPGLAFGSKKLYILPVLRGGKRLMFG